MTDSVRTRPSDWAERRRAVDISQSFIVQAPAGSGKTELLVQRMLALLAAVNTPEEILAITFTRKAAGEMKHRLIEALERAENDQPPQEDHARETWNRARRVLETDRRKGWHLTQNPSRLQLMTIDSLCALLTRRMPWLSGFGEQPGVAEQPEDLYLIAAERLVSRVDGNSAGQAAVERLLGHLDNRMTLLRDMLVSMLGRRDPWLRHMLGQRSTGCRDLLEAGLQRYLVATLARTCEALGRETCQTLTALGGYAAENLAETETDHPLLALSGATKLSCDIADLDAWLAIAHMVLTGGGTVRKSVDKRIGFPADKTPSAIEMKSRMTVCLDELRSNEHGYRCLRELRHLPAAFYTAAQWDVLEALIELLPLAVLELRDVFRSRGMVDFIEIAGAAHAALGDTQAPEDLLLQMDSMIRHILVDEFQDTSYAQFDLLQKLTAGWMPDDGRTLFIVGDPMQSIYRFREAEVGLFLRVCEQGLGDLTLERVSLTANFRSQAKLVDWSNHFFAGLFPDREDQVRGAVRFAPADAVRQGQGGDAVFFHGYLNRQDSLEAEQVVELVKQAHCDKPNGSVAVLVRSRNHLVEIIRAFKQTGMRFQAQDIDSLTDRPVVQDLLALTRALLHPADRIAWLAILRAPWCGLTLDDLLAICGRQPGATLRELLECPQEQSELFDRVSNDGQKRLDRTLEVLEHSMQMKGRLPLRRLVESTWLSLGGPACVDMAEMTDAGQFFLLLESLDEGGDLENLSILEKRLGRLFAAANPQAGPDLQVMTIHKAKGLEFDTVILPGIGRGVRPSERTLLRWLEHPDYELLLAPVPPATDDAGDPTYQAIGQILKDKDDLETLRLFYVAATRARNRLHLLGHYRHDREDNPSPTPGSFLATVWPSAAEKLTAGSTSSETDPLKTLPRLPLKRLPLDWVLPAIPERVSSAPISSRRASDYGHFSNDGMASRLTEEGRVVGTLVHAWLQQIAQDGLDEWSDSRLKNQEGLLRAQISSHGIPYNRHEACMGNILKCLINCIGCSRGRWLLSKHPEARCELAINGVIDDELVRAIIDRTFIDEQGCRWIIDYKTSQPGAGELLEAFLESEVIRYSDQMQIYKSLMQAYDTAHPVRLALYFPMFDGWAEVGGTA